MRLEGLSLRRTILIFIIGIALGILLLSQALVPSRKWLGERFEVRGDQYLLVEQFKKAETEYSRARELYPENEDIAQKLVWSQVGLVDIAKLRNFYASRGELSVIADINRATAEYQHPKEALEVALEYYKNGEFRYARYPAERAVYLDSNYPEAWHYLGLIIPLLPHIIF